MRVEYCVIVAYHLLLEINLIFDRAAVLVLRPIETPHILTAAFVGVLTYS